MAASFANNQSAVETALEGCPDPTSGRSVTVVSGARSICHQLRDGEGSAIDLSDIDPANQPTTTTSDPAATTLPPAPESIALMTEALCGREIYTTTLRFDNSSEGRVCFDIPEAIRHKTGIYRTEIAVRTPAGELYVTDKFLASIEGSLLSRASGLQGREGPLTLSEVRLQLRDFAGLNTLWDNVEFADAEIIHSLLLPITAFNEALPRSVAYNANNFPYRYQWLEAASANLLRIAATWYMRNSSKIQYGDNKTEDTKNRAKDYIQLAEAKWAAYLTFCTQTKLIGKWSGGGQSLGGTTQLWQ